MVVVPPSSLPAPGGPVERANQLANQVDELLRQRSRSEAIRVAVQAVADIQFDRQLRPSTELDEALLIVAQTAAEAHFHDDSWHSRDSLIADLHASYFLELAASAANALGHYELDGKTVPSPGGHKYRDLAVLLGGNADLLVAGVKEHKAALGSRDEHRVDAILRQREMDLGSVNRPDRSFAYWGTHWPLVMPERDENCSSVGPHTFARMRGYETHAKPTTRGRWTDPLYDWAYGDPRPPFNSLKELEDVLLQMDEGAMALISFEFTAHVGKGGHVTVVEHRNGQLFVNEGQRGGSPSPSHRYFADKIVTYGEMWFGAPELLVDEGKRAEEIDWVFEQLDKFPDDSQEYEDMFQKLTARPPLAVQEAVMRSMKTLLSDPETNRQLQRASRSAVALPEEALSRNGSTLSDGRRIFATFDDTKDDPEVPVITWNEKHNRFAVTVRMPGGYADFDPSDKTCIGYSSEPPKQTVRFEITNQPSFRQTTAKSQSLRMTIPAPQSTGAQAGRSASVPSLGR